MTLPTVELLGDESWFIALVYYFVSALTLVYFFPCTMTK